MKRKINIGNVLKNVGNTSKQIESKVNKTVRFAGNLDKMPKKAIGNNKSSVSIWSFWK